MDEGLILQRGNYKKRLSYQKSDVIFQLTYYFFCHTYLQRADRTVDQTCTHRQWEDGSAELAAMRKIGRTHSDAEYFMELARTRPPETIANMAIVLLKQADYLLHRQIQRLSEDFVKNGGFSERMTRTRLENRNRKWWFLGFFRVFKVSNDPKTLIILMTLKALPSFENVLRLPGGYFRNL